MISAHFLSNPPHTAIRDDTTMSSQAVRQLEQRIANLELILIESGGDNLSATFSPELVDALTGQCDFVIGSRYVAGGSTDAKWGLFRRMNSKFPTLLARPFTRLMVIVAELPSGLTV